MQQSNHKPTTANPQLFLAYNMVLKSVRNWQIAFYTIGLFLGVSIVANVILVANWQPQIRLVGFSDAKDSFFRLYPAGVSKSSITVLIRKSLRSYVKTRHSISDAEKELRLQAIKVNSSAQMTTQYIKEMSEAYEKFQGDVREVEILSDIDLAPQLHRVEFKTIDKKLGREDEVRFWEASIKYRGRKNHIISEANQFLNPIGIEIFQYSVSEVKNAKSK